MPKEVLQGTLYPALLRLERRRWIKSRWGVSAMFLAKKKAERT